MPEIMVLKVFFNNKELKRGILTFVKCFKITIVNKKTITADAVIEITSPKRPYKGINKALRIIFNIIPDNMIKKFFFWLSEITKTKL